MRDVRCDGEFKRPGLGGVCGQLLFRASSGINGIEIKCPRCKRIRQFVTTEPHTRADL